MYIHISKKGIHISLHINLNVLRKFMILCWATLIAVLGRMRPADHGVDSPVLTKLKGCASEHALFLNVYNEKTTKLIT